MSAPRKQKKQSPSSLPLEQKEEMFIRDVLSGMDKREAYKKHLAPGFDGDDTVITALVNAALTKPYIAARMNALKRGSGGTVDEIIDMAWRTIRNDETTMAERDRAIGVLKEFGALDSGETKTVDPSTMCEYLASFAGNPPSELDKMPGGLKGILRRLCSLCGIPAIRLLQEAGVLAEEEEPSKEPHAEEKPEG